MVVPVRVLAALLVVLALGCGVGRASAAEFSAELGVQGRLFLLDPVRSEQHGSIVSARFVPEFYHDWEDGDQRIAVKLFGRVDSGDPDRTHADVREAYWRKTFAGELDLYVGVRKVFWGVTETFHLADIINQTDFVENIDAEQKLGQPMVQATWVRDWGTVDAFVMPFFRERTFPGPKGRPGLPLPVDHDADAPGKESLEKRVDLALRWSHFVGDMDLGVAVFHGLDRLPFFLAGGTAENPVLVPQYALMTRGSLDAQYTRGSWLWKLEAVLRDKRSMTSVGAVGGFEYTLYQLVGSDKDLGLLLEYQFDDREELVPNNNDLAVGGRLTWNDVQDTQLLAFASVDLDHGGMFASVEGSRRVGSSWEASLEARFFVNAEPGDLLYSFRDDDYIELEITKFFY